MVVSTETTTFHIIAPEEEPLVTLDTTPSNRLVALRVINKVNKQIMAYIDLKSKLHAMLTQSTMLSPTDEGYTYYEDGEHIPEWIDGVNTKLNELNLTRDVYLFNAGEPIDYMPQPFDGHTPDWDVRAMSMRAAGLSEQQIAADRVALGDMRGIAVSKSVPVEEGKKSFFPWSK